MYGPTQIILILSGGYAYAQVNIEDPVHLIAPNNSGKTTLIATLQFLFIDDSRAMKFAQASDQTRRHYFPRPNSFVLFDCVTPSGRQVVGLHGSGPAESYQPQRFSYLGAYDRDDFFDGTKIRKLDTIKARLAGRELRYFEPREYRMSLLGIRDNKVRSLGIVPTKSARDYDTFRVLLSNLLHLHSIRQEDFRTFLVDICRAELRRPRIDVKHDFSRWYEMAERKSAHVRYLTGTAAPLYAELRRAIDAQKSARSEAVALWAALASRSESSAQAVAALEQRLAALSMELDASVPKKRERAQHLQTTRDPLVVKLNECRGLLDRAHQLDVICSELFCSSANATLEREQEAVDDLTARLAQTKSEPPAQLQQRLRATRKELDKDRAYLAENTVLVNWLAETGKFAVSEIDDLFRLLHPDLAAIPLSKFTIHDSDALVDRLRAEVERFDASAYESPVLAVSRESLPVERVSDLYPDRKTVEARVREYEGTLARLEALIKDARQRAGLVEELARRKQSLKDAQAQVALCGEWRELMTRLPALEVQAKELTEHCARLQEQIAAINAEIGKEEEKAKTLTERLGGVRSEHERLLQRLARIAAPPVDWALDPETAVVDLELQADDLVASYKSARSVEQQNTQSIRTHMQALGVGLPFLLEGDETETLKRLGEEIAAIPKAQEAVDEMWQSLFVELAGALRHIQDDVTKIHKMVREISREMNRHGISNLAAVTLDFTESGELLAELRSIEEGVNTPLLKDAEAFTAATSRLRHFLEARPVISIEQMFDVGFSVTRKSGQTKRYDSLDKIESNGTCATIKVLLHLALARRLLNSTEFRFPFFLDEVGAIDAPNCAAIVDRAIASNFVPVLASIDTPKECVRRIYQLDGEPPDVMVDERHCTTVERV